MSGTVISNIPPVGSELEKELQYAENEAPPLDGSILHLSPEQLDLLRSTLSMDDNQLRKHILEVQKEAYEEFPYTCIRLFSYINFYISVHPIYKEVLLAGREKQDTLFLDLACCMGADSRKLVFDGYPSKNIYATDLHARYLELGHKLFNDRDSCGITFFPADLFALPVAPGAHPATQDKESPLEKFRARATHIYAGLFFHLFDELMQKEVAKRLAVLISRKPGSIIFGSHAGKEPAGPFLLPSARVRYGHSPSTWTTLWKGIFSEMEGEAFANDRVEVNAKILDAAEFFNHKGFPLLMWSVKVV